MNQILAVENTRGKKQNKKASVKSVIIFFCIVLLIFGIAIISIGVISGKSKKETGSKVDNQNTTTMTSPNTKKPLIEIVQGISELNVNISSETEISNVVYKWNNEEETQVNGNNEKQISIKITIPLGNNILSIIATDVNGIKESYQGAYVGVEAYNPNIKLGQEGTNKLKIICESETNIKYISYHFDQEQETVTEVNNKSAEIPFTVKEGEHNFTIKVVNEEGKIYEDEKKLYIPEVKVVTDGENFIIKAHDTRTITRIELNLNGETQQITVNNTDYEGNIKLRDGENKLIIVVYNTDELSITKRVKTVK